jgi:glycosyltransferase involved in cell wall biosynthesis
VYNNPVAWRGDSRPSLLFHSKMIPHSAQVKDLNSGMRVALIYLGRRGAGGWISLELARQFQSMFPTLAVISSYTEQRAIWEKLNTDRLITHTYRNALSALASMLMPIEVSRLVRKIKSFRPDVLLFPMFHPWNALIERRMPNIPSVVFVHDPHPHPDLTGWVYGKLEQSSIRQAERCIILSENLMDEMLKRGIKPEQVDVIPLGPFRLNTRRKLNPLKRNIPTLLFFGRIVLYKGLDILLQAYADIRQTHQARLVIAGEGDLKPYQNMLRNLPDLEVINHWIPEDEIEELFLKSDLLVLPYTGASQSGVIPIAAALGLPVIATCTGGIPEQIEDGKSGWLVEPASKDALAAAIMEALNHPELTRQRGEALRMRYESQLFSWEQIARQVGESLKKAAQTTGQK